MKKNEIKILNANLTEEIILYIKDEDGRLSSPILNKEEVRQLIKDLKKAIGDV